MLASVETVLVPSWAQWMAKRLLLFLSKRHNRSTNHYANDSCHVINFTALNTKFHLTHRSAEADGDAEVDGAGGDALPGQALDWSWSKPGGTKIGRKVSSAK